jgi:hypothetical protein
MIERVYGPLLISGHACILCTCACVVICNIILWMTHAYVQYINCMHDQLIIIIVHIILYEYMILYCTYIMHKNIIYSISNLNKGELHMQACKAHQ